MRPPLSELCPVWGNRYDSCLAYVEHAESVEEAVQAQVPHMQVPDTIPEDILSASSANVRPYGAQDGAQEASDDLAETLTYIEDEIVSRADEACTICPLKAYCKQRGLQNKNTLD